MKRTSFLPCILGTILECQSIERKIGFLFSSISCIKSNKGPAHKKEEEEGERIRGKRSSKLSSYVKGWHVSIHLSISDALIVKLRDQRGICHVEGGNQIQEHSAHHPKDRFRK